MCEAPNFARAKQPLRLPRQTSIDVTADFNRRDGRAVKDVKNKTRQFEFEHIFNPTHR
jgi:hypothetical protein